MKNNFKKNHLFLLGTLLILSLFQIKMGQAENKINSLPTESRIVVGIKSQPDAWPWMAAILYADRSGSAYQRQFCGGTLIAPQWILTAAHCAIDSLGGLEIMEVLLDRNNLNDTEGEIISVDSVIFHPDYNNEMGYADIALLHLETPTIIQPVALADTFNFQSETGNVALAMGWGVYLQERNLGVSQQYYPENLQQINFVIESSLDCLLNSTDNTICIAIGQANIGTICSADSGGPLLIWDEMIQNWKQIGISSKSSVLETFTGDSQCAESKGRNIFTQVDKYQAFINATIKPAQFLTQCATKYSDYVGQITSTSFICDEKYLCLNTSGGRLNIQQISILRDNPGQNLEYFTKGQWLDISYANLGYCK